MSSFSPDLINQDYEIKIGAYFNRGWEIFKQQALLFILFTVLLLVIQVVVLSLPTPLGAGGGENSSGAGLLSFVFNVVAPALTAGYYFVAFQLARGRSVVFGDFFQGFNKFLPIFLTWLVSSILILIGLALLILPGIYLIVAYLFAQPLVIDKGAGFWQAMETSRQLITKKWLSFLGLLLLIGLLNLAGAIPLCLGLLITIPLSFCIITAAYEDIVGLNSVAELTQ